MPELSIGRMDRIITIEYATPGQGSVYGEPTQVWATWARVWANVYSGAGRELEAARQITAEITTQFQIRYISGLAATMRIVYNGQTYDIHRIQEVGRRRRWNIFATARQA